jgi:vancomycin resistance protein YoaR
MPRTLRYTAAASMSVLLIGGAVVSAHAQTTSAQHHKHHTSKAAASQWISGRLAERVRLGDGLRTYHPSLHQLGARYAAGQSDDTPIAQVQFTVDRATLRQYLTSLAPIIRRSPVDARPEVSVHNASDDAEEVPAHVLPGHDGATLEVDAAVDMVQKAIVANPQVKHIILPVKVQPQKVTAADLAGIDGRIAYFVTHFNPGEVGRTLTVRKAIDIVDGTVVKPGQTFSLNGVVGPRDPKHGFFGKSEVFIDGKSVIQSGGGMCQVATTLFNATMLADLKVVERHQHMRTIPYAPPGSDATVYFGEKDFRFENDTDVPVYISFRTTYSHAIIALFGKSVPGRTVRIIRRSHQIAQRHFTGSISRVVHEPDGTVQRGPTFYSDYIWTKALDYNQ